MRAFLDACVLYPSVLREILTGVAARHAYTPLWSERVLAEWQHAAARLGDTGALVARSEVALLRAAFPKAVCPADPAAEALLDLPDAADKHIVASAAAGGAERIITLNLRDFPSRALFALNLRAQSPDDFLMDLWLTDPRAVEDCVAEVQATTARLSGRPQPLRALLKRASLPRLGKALDGSN
jgi:hypothetical protein